MKKAVAVMLVTMTILALSLSLANAVCIMPTYGKVTYLVQDGQSLKIRILQNGTTNIFWVGNIAWNNPTLSLYSSAMATGLNVKITGDAGYCSYSAVVSTGEKSTMVGNIVGSTFTNKAQ